MNAAKIRKIVSHVLSVVLFLVLIVMVFAVISSKASGGEPNFFGYELKSVLSGSMEPTFKTGSIIAVKPVTENQSFEVDDIITFRKNEQEIVTHRIINVIHQGGQLRYETKGDNNEDPDSELVLSTNVVGQYTGFTIPFVGYFVNFATSKNGTALLLILPGLLLLAYAGFTIWQVISQFDFKPKIETKAEEDTLNG